METILAVVEECLSLKTCRVNLDENSTVALVVGTLVSDPWLCEYVVGIPSGAFIPRRPPKKGWGLGLRIILIGGINSEVREAVLSKITSKICAIGLEPCLDGVDLMFNEMNEMGGSDPLMRLLILKPGMRLIQSNPNLSPSQVLSASVVTYYGGGDEEKSRN